MMNMNSTNSHNNGLTEAVKMACHSLKPGEEIHQVFSWDSGQWAFVTLMDDDPFDWRVLLLYAGGHLEDISYQFQDAPTINKTYAELEL